MIDIGITNKKLQDRLKTLSIDPNQIDVIFITHEHIDHIQGLKVFLNKYNPKVYISRGTYSALGFEIKNVSFINVNDVIELFGSEFHILHTSHDANESNGVMIKNEEQKIVHITDTGYINEKTLKKIIDANVYLMESNYDPEILMNNDRYPFKTKQRIISDLGHLSNLQCHDYLEEIVTHNTNTILYAHLSENNNMQSYVIDLNKNIDVHNQIVLQKDEIVEVVIEN